MAILGGKYELGERIGAGGMAEVYRATVVGAQGFSRPVAIKRVLRSLSSEPAFGDMFVNEAKIASLLHHPNVVSVLDFDRDDQGRYYLVMELVEGVDLKRLALTGPLPLPVVVHVVSQLLSGLDYAHDLVHEGRPLEIVHRDVSPHNILLGWGGAVKLGDFGIAKAVASSKMSQSGALKGKVGYMSPEQAHAERLDGRSDLFACGVVLHELLTGARLFPGRTEPEVLSRLLTQPIPDPREVRKGIPEDLVRIAMRLLERDRARRFQVAHDALEDLLRTGSATARGSFELRDLLRQKFPAHAPVRRRDTEPVDPRAPGGKPSVDPLAATATPPRRGAPAPRGRPTPWESSGESGSALGVVRAPTSSTGPTRPIRSSPSPVRATLTAAGSGTEPDTTANDASRPMVTARRGALVFALVVLASTVAVSGTLLWRRSAAPATTEPQPHVVPTDAGGPSPDEPITTP